jgi:hypothetical protein
MRLSGRFSEALLYAAAVHADQRRKVSGEPYLAHLLGAAAIVLEHGGNEDEAIAALLHDTIEDQARQEEMAVVWPRYEIVEGCSDTDIRPAPGGSEEAHVARLRQALGPTGVGGRQAAQRARCPETAWRVGLGSPAAAARGRGTIDGRRCAKQRAGPLLEELDRVARSSGWFGRGEILKLGPRPVLVEAEEGYRPGLI